MQSKKYKEPIRTWCCTQHDEAAKARIKEIAEVLNIKRITAGLLYDRIGGADITAASHFIDGEAHFHDPFMMKDMDKACDKITAAIERGEHITVYGDYDVDGVTSVSVLTAYLKRRGLKNCSYYIPCRLGEGYGLSTGAINKVKQSGTTFMITVDTGITAIEEIAYAESIGIETVVTDHHECRRGENDEIVVPDVPCVNPRQSKCTYPFDELAGVGVVFKLICALEMKRLGVDSDTAAKAVIDEFGELVAIGTVADVMPLVDENRAIVKAGLELMRDPRFVGTRELISLCAGIDFDKKPVKKLSTTLISFTLAPRINAVGRMGSAATAVELFASTDRESAAKRALELSEMNTVRQQEENAILSEALAMIDESDVCDKVIVLDNDKWHHGVIGIVASRITERYGLPSILISFEGNVDGSPKDTDIGKGSGRSVKGLDLVKALDACKEKLVRFGGHELAAGLTIERGELEDFRRAINEHAQEVFEYSEAEQKLYADASVELGELDEELARELYLLEPYGQANPSPQFMIENVKIRELYPLKEGKHVKLTASDGTNTLTALWFGKKYSDFEFALGDSVDLFGTLELNEYMGRTCVQLHIKDIRASKEADDEINDSAGVYKAALHGGAYPADMLPDRDDFAAVYRYLKSVLGQNEEMLKYRLICSHALKKEKMPYIKLRAVLDIMCELALISYAPENNTVCRIGLNKQSNKVDLESSELLAALRRRAAKQQI
ncbi:MAG: single-stranded-DNA-specific exonuclease RecJ [Clostridia bacterium]|nr:single-stranded-DNA-specific exonuclease RecJ [Clostridia bacterium]